MQINDTQVKIESQPFFSKGNRCGHNKLKPRFPSYPSDVKRRPHVIEELKRRIIECFEKRNKYEGLIPVFYHEGQENKTGRKRRSEKTESVLFLVLYALAHDCHLNNMQFGQYLNNNVFRNYNYNWIVKHTGCSLKRVQRAMIVLQTLGWVKVEKIVKTLNDGHIVTDNVIITLSDTIFKVFDLENEFLENREKVCIRFQEKQIRVNRNRMALYQTVPFAGKKMRMIEKKPKKMIDLINGLFNKEEEKEPEVIHKELMTSFNEPKNEFYNPPKGYNAAQDKDVLYQAGELIKKDKNLTLADAIKIVLCKKFKFHSPPS